MSEPFVIDTFGGLNLRDDPTEVGAGGATELKNVDILSRGRLATRPGAAIIKSLSNVLPGGIAAYKTSGGTRQLVVGYTTSAGAGTKTYQVLNPDGSVVSTLTTGINSVGFQSSAAIANGNLYLTTTLDTLRKWNGSAFSTIASTPKAAYLTLKPNSGRLVAGRTDGGNSRVHFSNVPSPAGGGPEVFGTDDWVDLSPGDGSPILGLASWQDDVYVFKSDKFFVFGGESTDSTGGAVFNYRTVAGSGAIIPPVSGREGVYYFDGRSVFLTNGGAGQRISDAIDPFFAGDATLNDLTMDPAHFGNAYLYYAVGKLYLGIFTTSNVYTTFVYDPAVGAWTIYTNQMWGATELNEANSTDPTLYFIAPDGVWEMKSTHDLEDRYWYASGWYDLGLPGQEKVLTDPILTGQGINVEQGLQIDYQRYDPNVFWHWMGGGTRENGITYLSHGHMARRGRWFQHQLAGSTRLELHRIELNVRHVAAPSQRIR